MYKYKRTSFNKKAVSDMSFKNFSELYKEVFDKKELEMIYKGCGGKIREEKKSED